MILRKPYAILIKYFKLIHILMFVFLGYLVFVLRKIYLFFSDYAKTSNFTYVEDMASQYIPLIVFIFVIILLAFGIGILLLMRKKDKPVLYYKVLIIYSVILLIAFIYFLIFFKSLDNTVYPPLRIVINRDIILFIYIINYFFVAMSFIRGFGFDIKKFSFDRDKKELNIEDSDKEEYELNVNIDKDDIASFVNKQKREFKYYFKENSLVFTIIGIVLFVGLGIFIYVHFFVTNKVYKENEAILHNNVSYMVKNSYITNLSKYGKEIDKNADYLIVKLNIMNNNQFGGYLDSQALRAHVDEEYFYPSVNTCEMFDDLGECFKNQEIKLNSNKDYILVYRMNKTHEKINLEILKNKKDTYNYYKIALKPQDFKQDIINYQMSDSFKIGDTDYKINSYQITNKSSYQYQDCEEGKCLTYTKIVQPKTGEMVLILDIDNLDKLDNNLIDSYFGIRYDNTLVSSKDIKYLDKNQNKVFFSVPSILESKSNLVLSIGMRTKEYRIQLVGGN